MTKVKIHSNNVKYVGYDVHHQVLEISFSNGETYQHRGVPQWVYDHLIHSQHPGYYLHAHIRNSYPVKKIH